MKSIISVTMCLLLAFSVSACSAKSVSQVAPQAMPSPPEQQMGEMSSDNLKSNENSTGGAAENSIMPMNSIGAAVDRKIIYEAYLNLEALDFDKALADIILKLEQENGYTSKSMIEGKKGESNRYAEYTFRIPQQNYNKFKATLSELTNVISQTENANDITSEYVDIEARLKSLNTQEKRLLSMMETAGELETLLAVQNQLADVQYRIESITAQKNTYDKLTQYATINISLYEVSRITETQKDSFIQRVGVAFRESWVNFSEGVQRLTIAMIYALPTLLIVGLLISIIILIIIRTERRKKKYPVITQETIKEDKV